jgi:hypothetical protein
MILTMLYGGIVGIALGLPAEVAQSSPCLCYFTPSACRYVRPYCTFGRGRPHRAAAVPLLAAWIEDFLGSKPTVKQKLAALRMSFDFLAARQFVSSNP